MKRFWDKVEKTENCWNWTAKLRNKNGYGAFKYFKKTVQSHRFVWFLTYGYWPKLNILHKCDNKRCVNPNHLYIGTQKDNVRDMFKRGRVRIKKGEEAPSSKLTKNQVINIRKQYIPNIFGAKRLAKIYNVTYKAIQSILTNKSWKHI